MRHLKKPTIKTKNVIEDISNAKRDTTLSNKLKAALNYFDQEEIAYETAANIHELYSISTNSSVNGNITKDEMIKCYEVNFAKGSLKTKYYDKLMAGANTGKCPICGIGAVSTLDHYLAKSCYPTYALTPINLIPVCSDCNKNKHDSIIKTIVETPLHPYYEEVDAFIWLKAKIIKEKDSFIVKYYVDDSLNKTDSILYQRLVYHCEKVYKLFKLYSINATVEIAENLNHWRELLLKDKLGFVKLIEGSLNSKESVQRNTWNTALLRALIENVDVLK